MTKKVTGKILKIVGWSVAAIMALSFGLGVYAGYNGLQVSHMTGSMFGITAAFMVVILVATLAGCIVWWNSVDEAVREAHKWAWYWGGTVGIIIPAMVFGLSTTKYNAGFLDRFSDAALASHGLTGLQAGILISIIPLMVGYGVGWVIWWMRHR